MRFYAVALLASLVLIQPASRAQSPDSTVLQWSREYIQQQEALGTFDRHAYDEYVESIHQPAQLGGGERTGDCDCYVEPDVTWNLISPNQFNPNSLDGSFGPVNLPFGYCFFGDPKTQFWINTKGTITFDGPNTTFVPEGFPSNAYEMIAGFWADIDINGAGSILYKVTPTAAYIAFVQVGYYFQHDNLRNSFQIIITNGEDPVIGVGNNLAFCYKDMQWAAGDWNGGVGGFGGTAAATVGANRGSGNDFFQVGRFLNNNENYDGPFGNNDGVHWLDFKSFTYNACFNSDNIPPIPSTEGGCDTLYVCQNETLEVEISFFAPEQGQTVNITVDTSEAPSFVVTEENDGVFASASGYITGSPDNIGFQYITFTGTDNGVPAQTTSVSYVIEVLDLEAPPISISGNLDFCGGGSTVLTATEGFDDYVWSTSCAGQTCEVFNDGIITVTGIYEGCSSSATVEVVETEYFLPPITIAEQPICSTDSTLVTSNNVYNTYSWGNYLDYPGTVYSDDTTQQSIYLSAGTFILQVTTEGGCIGQRIFNIDATDATIPEDTWSGAYCEGLEDLEFCCGFASADAGNFTLYMFNTQGNWTLASLDIYVNGELILEDVQAPTPNTPLWTPGFTIYYGDFIEIYYDPGNSTGTQSLSALNCTNSPFQLFSIPLTDEGLIWSGFAACPSSPPVGYWEILEGPDGASFSDETQWNSTFTPGDYGTYDLHFFSATCGIDYFYEVIYSAPPAVTLIPEINECGDVENVVLIPEISDPVNDATIAWSTGETSDEISVSETGVYCITISNACGTEEACADVVIEPIPAIDLESDYLLCDETSVTLDPIAEDDPSYNYSWAGPGLNSSGSSVVITQSGTYTLNVTNNCGSDDLEFSVVLEPTPVGNNLQESYTLCDEPSITIDPIANDDDSFGYSWSGPGLFTSSQSVETIEQSGTYTVIASNECGEVSATFEIIIVEDLSVSVNSLSLCDDPSGNLIATANQGGVIYTWSTGGSGSSIEVSSPGEYCVTAANVCESQQACGTVSFNFTPVVSSNLASIENLCPGIEVTLTASAGPASGLTWSWVVDCGGSENLLQNSGSSQVITGDLATESCPEGFTVFVTGTNVCGSDVTSIPVSLDACLLTLPNVFSPNSDDINDVFSIEGLENYIAFGGVSLKVFNRWGNLVFESNNYKNDWEAEGIDAGTYYYVLSLPNQTEEKGAITIVK